MLLILRLDLIEFWISSAGVFSAVRYRLIKLDVLPLLLLLFAAYILIPYEIVTWRNSGML